MEYIERGAARKFLIDEYTLLQRDLLIRTIGKIPAADVRPVVRGRWTDAAITADNLYDTHGMLYQIRGYICNCCREFSIARFNFCPNCGAEMVTEDE